MAITINHHALAIAFGILGNIISFLVFLAPVPTFYRIFKRKSTESFQCLPYLMALFSSMLWMYYAMLKGNALLLITINAIGCVIETVYIVMFITYAPVHKRISAFKLLVSMNLGVFALILLVTQFLLKGNVKVAVLGWICVCFSVSVFAAPLMIMARVIKTKSVEFMPFTLSFFLTISAVMWFGYGLLLKDIWIAIPNIIGFVLGLVQMMLYVFYKNAAGRIERVAAASETDLSELPTTVKNIVIFRTIVGDDGVLIPVEIQRCVTNNEEIKEDEAEVVDEAQTEDQEKSFEISSGIQEDESPV